MNRSSAASKRSTDRATKGVFLAVSDTTAATKLGVWTVIDHDTQTIRAFIERHVPTAGIVASETTLFPTPPMAKRSDVAIRFIDGHTNSSPAI